MKRWFAPSAMLATGWARDVLIETDERGFIASTTPGSSTDGAERLAGPVVPGMPNLHSHAFQRAMAGLTEKGGPAGDSFWSWREQMYRFLERLTPDDVEAIATRLYVEMLEAGYTGVAEFHYLHHDATGHAYADPAEMAWRHVAAAEAAGIGLTLLPVFYAHAGFGDTSPTPGQRRFVHAPDAFAHLLEALAPRLRGQPLKRLGVAPHSLRAVTPDELSLVVAALDAIDPTAPRHIHAAEQRKEVDDSLAWSGRRPVEWLLNEVGLDPRWTLIHATHMTLVEAQALARTGAVAGLCPSTEGDLGDGFFQAPVFLAAGGAFGIGGDSHAGVDPFDELRWFEYGQRLQSERRNVLVSEIGASLGGTLYRQAARGGARALAQPVGALAPGLRADWVVLDINDAALAEQHGDGLLDAAIFGPARQPVRDVVVGGEWRVREGRHPLAADSLARYRRTLKGLLA